MVTDPGTKFTTAPTNVMTFAACLHAQAGADQGPSRLVAGHVLFLFRAARGGGKLMPRLEVHVQGSRKYILLRWRSAVSLVSCPAPSCAPVEHRGQRWAPWVLIR
jgi:hypothetical protein